MRARWAALPAAALLLLSASSCHSDAGTAGQDRGGAPVYLTHRTALTLNAASVEGASTDAEALAARIYPGAMIAGPGGQMLPNTDLVHAQRLPGPDTRIHYTIAEKAAFSDGHPMSCDDYLLAATAAMMPQEFGSFVPVAAHIDSIECAEDGRSFDVSYAPGYGQRWQQLFGPGTVLPFHAIVAKAGMPPETARDALRERDAERLAPLIDVWRHGFALDRPDRDLLVSSGPYRLSEVRPGGDLHLVANEHYAGDAPRFPDMYVRPGREKEKYPEAESPVVVDILDKDATSVPRDDDAAPVDIIQDIGQRTDSLVLAPAGVMGKTEARRALASCIDTAAVAEASSTVSGVKVPKVSTRVTPASDPTFARVDPQVEPEARGSGEDIAVLEGTTIRIAYRAPHQRFRSMVEAMVASCASHGITLEDVSSTKVTMADVVGITKGEEGFIDAFLLPVDGPSTYDLEPLAPGQRSSVLRTEQELWRSIPTIPLAAEPRTFAVDRRVGNVVVCTGPAGIGWNMDRWRSVDHA